VATVTLQVVAGATTIISVRTVSNTNASRVLAAKKIDLRTADDQSTVDEMLKRVLNEWIGDTFTIEKNQAPPAPIPVT
jgi:predicted SpoU family rRNA methylase